MPVELKQLEAFAVFIEHIGSEPLGPYRPAALARALSAQNGREFSETRVRRWLVLLAKRGWLRRLGKDYYQSGLFQTWGDNYAKRILFPGASK